MRRVNRDRPTVLVAEVLARAPRGVLVEERSYEFLTPVFGGGVRIEGAKKYSDPVTPVRVPSIRGQLRFWWRAVNPRGCVTKDSLREEEAKVFGAASSVHKGVLDVAVVRQPAKPGSKDVYRVELNQKLLQERNETRYDQKEIDATLGYAAFPLRDDRKAHELNGEKPEPGVLHVYTGRWTVRFSFGESIQDDIEAALWAWTHFGGLGGRTRRGFGAIKQSEAGRLPLPTLDQGWARWIMKPDRREDLSWPTLRADRATWMASIARCGDSADAQAQLLGRLKRLRQVELGRRDHSSRSRWPEPDAIRRLTDQRFSRHAEAVTHVDVFPRAAFGMPIVFHFKDDKKGDPADTQLQPEVGGTVLGRLTSPLVLRPRLDENDSIEALALVLSHPPPKFVALMSGRRRVGGSLRWQLAAGEEPAPMVQGTNTFTDPLRRFLHLVRTGR